MADFSSIRGLAFDLDGTLVDSAPGLAAAIDMALAEMGLRRPVRPVLAPGLVTVPMCWSSVRCAGQRWKPRRSDVCKCVNVSTISMGKP